MAEITNRDYLRVVKLSKVALLYNTVKYNINCFMETITDFDAWLSCIDLSDFNDVYSLYHTVADLNDWSSFEISIKKTTKGPMYFLKSNECDDILMFASEKARKAFLYKIERAYCGDMGNEEYYAYHHSMERDDQACKIKGHKSFIQ